ncbi:MAG: N-acetylmuramoyl-L-alanine amidase [Clostridia bacterium]|nr:N-acetylmuramoyl-L-alanine amidase [Clostridia bacterium]
MSYIPLILRRILAACLLATLLLTAVPVLAVHAEEAEEREPVVITLDPGHGGKKSADGSTGTGTAAAEKFGGKNELFYTLSISEYCKERLEQYQNVEVYLTRDNNEDCPGLVERADMAKEHGSDALISIHNNAASNASAKGAEIIIPNKNLNAKIGEDSEACAGVILNTMVEQTGVTRRRIYTKDSTSDKYADNSVADHFKVIRHGKIHEIGVVMIVECAFLSCEEDYVNHFSDEDKLKAMGYAIADGLAAYYELVPIPEMELIHASNDELRYLDESGTQIGQAFIPGQIEGWNNALEIEEGSVHTLVDWGWIAYRGDTLQFGYIVNDAEIFDDAFTAEAEQSVLDTAANLGAPKASRFKGELDTSLLKLGENRIKFCVRLNGELTEVLREYTVTLTERVTEAPTEVLTEAVTTAEPDIEPAPATGCGAALTASALLIVLTGAAFVGKKKD